MPTLSHSPPSPLTPARPLTPPPRRPRTPATPAPSSPRVATVPLPDISPSPGPVPITVTGPSTPVGGVFGLEPWSLAGGLGLGTATPGGTTTGMSYGGYGHGYGSGYGGGYGSIHGSIHHPAANHGYGNECLASLPPSGSGTPTRTHTTMTPAGLMALHNSFDLYDRAERRWVATSTSTPAASAPPSETASPEGSPARRNMRMVSLPVSRALMLPELEDGGENGREKREKRAEAGEGDGNADGESAEDGARTPEGTGAETTPRRAQAAASTSSSAHGDTSPTSPVSVPTPTCPTAGAPRSPASATASAVPSPPRSPSTTTTASLASPSSPSPPASPRSPPFTLAMPPFLHPPRTLRLADVRARRAQTALPHWPAVTRVAGHTVIHRAVPGKEVLVEGYQDVEVVEIDEEGGEEEEGEEGEEGDEETALSAAACTLSPTTGVTGTIPAPVRPVAHVPRRPSRAPSPAIFGPDLAGPLVARIARSRAAGTPEAWWAWGAPAIRAAAWGVLEDAPPAQVLTAAWPHSHARSTMTTTTQVISSTQTEEREEMGGPAGFVVTENDNGNENGNEHEGENDDENETPPGAAEHTHTTTTTTTETTTTTTTTTTTSCACNDALVVWGDGGGFTTRLGSFVFAPPFAEPEAAALRASAAAAAAALTVCDGACGCAEERVEIEVANENHFENTSVELHLHDVSEDEVTPTEKTPTRGTPWSLRRALPPLPSLPPSVEATPAWGTEALPSVSAASTCTVDASAMASANAASSASASTTTSAPPYSTPTSPARSSARSRPSSTDEQGLLGLSLSFRPNIRLSMPTIPAFDSKTEKDKEAYKPSVSASAPSSPPMASVSVPVPVPGASEPTSPRSRRLGNVFGLSPRKRR